MPLLYLILIAVIVGFVSIYLDRRFVRKRSTTPQAPEARTASKAQETQEEKNGSN